MIRNHWKTNAGKILSVGVLILATVAMSEQIHVRAQTPDKTTMQSTTPTIQTSQGRKKAQSTMPTSPAPQAPASPAPETQAQSQLGPCRLPKSTECLEVRINELTDRTAALEKDLNAIRELLQELDKVLEQRGDEKGDLASSIQSIWNQIDRLNLQVFGKK